MLVWCDLTGWQPERCFADELLGVALDEFRLLVAEVAASVFYLSVHEVDEREICRGQSGGARAMCVLRPAHL